MLVWGGQLLHGGTYLADGEALDPVRGTWSTIPKAPLHPRSGSVAVWTGSHLIVWGGEIQGPSSRQASFSDGASYDPVARAWTKLPAAPLRPRTEDIGVWTGSKVLIWGGAVVGGAGGKPKQGGEGDEEVGGKLLDDGAAYDPDSHRWTSIAPAPIQARAGHVAVWTGREMLVWGGATLSENVKAPAFTDGAAYDPNTDAWRSIGAAPVSPGGSFAAVWTGSRMIVWGGVAGQGAVYDPATNRWVKLPKAPIPTLSTPTAVWTGRLMVVWGGPERQPSPERRVALGAAYDPATNRWIPLPGASGAPGLGQGAIWTGRQMLVWGGFAGRGRFSKGAAFSPASAGG